MKNKRKIWKIIGGLAGIAAFACIIPACVVSCGSSSTSDTNSNANSSSSSSTSTTNNPNPKTNDVGLIATNVGKDATLETNDNTNNSNNFSSYELLFGYPTELSFPWVSCYYLNVPNNQYTISLATDSNMYTYQWYQVPVTSLYDVFGSQIVKSTLSAFNSQITLPAKVSGVNFMEALVKQSNAINNATSPTYQFDYGVTLNDAIYFCKIQNGNNSFYSQVTWLQQKDPINTLGNVKYGINELVNNGQSITTIESNQNQDIPNNTKIDFNLNMVNSDNEPLSYQDFNDNDPYYLLYAFNINGGSDNPTIQGVNPPQEYVALNLSKMESWNKSIVWTTSYIDMDALILNANGQILNLSTISDELGAGSNEFEVGVKNYDPLKIANAKCTVNTSLKATTNSDTQEVYNVKANSQLTFTLKINNFDVSDFTNTDYYITWSLQSDETESSSVDNQTEIIKMLPLSNENAWAFTITVPAGKYYFNVQVYNGLYVLYENPNAIINASN